MKVFDIMCRFFLRFRYPVTLPEDVAIALGVDISNFVTFEQFIEKITCPSCKPTKLTKFMLREKAEEAFHNAQRKECFIRSTLFSFYFSEGWMEFVLEFDEMDRLRRLYLNHQFIKPERGIEISLPEKFFNR